MERIRVDLENGTAERLPEGVAVQAVHRRAGRHGAGVPGDVRPRCGTGRCSRAGTTMEDGTEADILDRYSWSYDGRRPGAGTVWLPLKKCHCQDAVLAGARWSPASAEAETPVTIPIK